LVSEALSSMTSSHDSLGIVDDVVMLDTPICACINSHLGGKQD